MKNIGIKLVLIVALGVFLLSFRLGGNALFLDEVMGLRIATGSPREVVEQSLDDVHPPLHFLILNAWTNLGGTSEVSARSLSVVFAALTIVLTYVCARRVLPEETALFAALLVAISPYMVLYGRLARYYSLVAFLYLLSVIFLVRACRRRSLGAWTAYAAATVLLLYTNYIGLLAIPGCLLYAAWRGRRCLARYLLALACIFLAFLPLVPWMVSQSQRFGAAARPEGAVKVVLDIAAKGAYSLYALCLGETVLFWDAVVVIPAIAMMAFLLVYGLGRTSSSGEEGRRIWLSFCAVPLLCIAFISSLPFVGVFSARSVALFPARVVMLAPLAYMVAANGLCRLPRGRRLCLSAAVAAIFLYSLVNLYSGSGYLNEKYVSPWRDVAQFVETGAGETAFVASREAAFWYYYHGGDMEKVRPEGRGRMAGAEASTVWIVDRMRGDTTLGGMPELGPSFPAGYRLREVHPFQPLDERKRSLYARLRGRDAADHYIEVRVYERIDEGK